MHMLFIHDICRQSSLHIREVICRLVKSCCNQQMLRDRFMFNNDYQLVGLEKTMTGSNNSFRGYLFCIIYHASKITHG